MNNKRIMVRVMNHVAGIDSHHMGMSSPANVLETISSMIDDLAQTTGYPLVGMATTLLDVAQKQGDAMRSTHYQDNWLIQLRIDDKLIVGPRSAANDNQSAQMEVNR